MQALVIHVVKISTQLSITRSHNICSALCDLQAEQLLGLL